MGELEDQPMDWYRLTSDLHEGVAILDPGPPPAPLIIFGGTQFNKAQQCGSVARFVRYAERGLATVTVMNGALRSTFITT